eukprot:gene9973-11645_t
MTVSPKHTNIFVLIPLNSSALAGTATYSSSSKPLSFTCIPPLPTSVDSAVLVPVPATSNQLPSYFVKLAFVNAPATPLESLTCSVPALPYLNCQTKTTSAVGQYLVSFTLKSFTSPPPVAPISVSLSYLSSSVSFPATGLFDLLASPTTTNFLSVELLPSSGSTAVGFRRSITTLASVTSSNSLVLSTTKVGSTTIMSTLYGPVSGTPIAGTYVDFVTPITSTKGAAVAGQTITAPFANISYTAAPGSSDDHFVDGGTPLFATYWELMFNGPFCSAITADTIFRRSASIEYPFGLQEQIGTAPPKYSFTQPSGGVLSPTLSVMTLSCADGGISRSFQTPSPASASKAPYITAFSAIPFTFQSVLVKITLVTDATNSKGFAKLTLGSKEETFITYKDLATAGSNTYEKELFFGKRTLKDVFPMQVIDNTGNVMTYSAGAVINADTTQTIVLDFINPFDSSSISNVWFMNQAMDVGQGPANNSINFKLTPKASFTVAPDFYPTIEFKFTFMPEPLTFVGVYDPVSSTVHIPFTLPFNIIGGIVRYSLFLPFEITWEEIFASVGQSASLNVISPNGNQLPPMVNAVNRILPASSAGYWRFGWELTLANPDAFDHGSANITGVYDHQPFTVSLTRSDLSGSKLSVIISTLSTNCRTQSYSFAGLTLTDASGFSSILNSRTTLDPFARIYGVTAKESLLTIPVTCTQTTDSFAPSIRSLTISSQTIDTMAVSRTLSFEIGIFDNGTGISVRHAPIFYLSTLGFDIIAQISTFTKKNDTCYFAAKFDGIPYGFGADTDVYVSIFGASDMASNILGASTVELMGLSALTLAKSATTTRSFTPYLVSHKPVSSLGGVVTVLGRSFPLTTTSFTGTSSLAGMPTLDITAGSYTYFTFTVGAFNAPFTIVVNSGALVSNSIVIHPTAPSAPNPSPTPSPTPSVTPTETTPSPTPTETTPSPTPTDTPTPTPTVTPTCPPCKFGTCNQGNGTCDCNDGWRGQLCDQVVDDGGVIVNPNEPTVTSGVDITSVISIVAVRELDYSGVEHVSYPLANSSWTMYNYTATNNSIASQATTTAIYSTNFAINVHNYVQSAILDPDFSFLIDTKDTANGDDQVCTKKKSGLSKTSLIAIIVCASAIGVALIVGGAWALHRRLDSQKLRKSMKLIGSGSYGKVYRAVNTTTGAIVALKIISVMNLENGVPVEVKYLNKLKECSNIVQLSDHFYTNECIKFFIGQLLKGLLQCHAKKIMHLDIKPSNLLIDSSFNLKLADFGFTTYFGNPHLTNQVISLFYRPPELLMGTKDYGPEVDIWSVGCIMAEMLSGNYLFAGSTEDIQLDLIFRAFGTPNERNWPGVRQLPGYKPFTVKNKKYPTHKIKDFDRIKTITCGEALNHAWFQELPNAVAPPPTIITSLISKPVKLTKPLSPLPSSKRLVTKQQYQIIQQIAQQQQMQQQITQQQQHHQQQLKKYSSSNDSSEYEDDEDDDDDDEDEYSSYSPLDDWETDGHSLKRKNMGQSSSISNSTSYNTSSLPSSSSSTPSSSTVQQPTHQIPPRQSYIDNLPIHPKRRRSSAVATYLRQAGESIHNPIVIE